MVCCGGSSGGGGGDSGGGDGDGMVARAVGVLVHAMHQLH